MLDDGRVIAALCGVRRRSSLRGEPRAEIRHPRPAQPHGARASERASPSTVVIVASGYRAAVPAPLVLLMAATVDEELAEVCGERPSWSCEVVWNVTGSRVLARGADWFISRPLAAGLVLLVAWIANRWLRRAVSSGVDRFTKSSRFA